MFTLFWNDWKQKKGTFESLSQWWELGKTQIKVFCQNYTACTTAKIKTTIQRLEKEILNLETDLGNQNTPEVGRVLLEKRQDLGFFLQEWIKGALVRARMAAVTDMDVPSAFFFNLERKVMQQKQMLHLRRSDGTLTADPAEMRRLAVCFYSELYAAGGCNEESAAQLFQGLPELSPQQRETLVTNITF